MDGKQEQKKQFKIRIYKYTLCLVKFLSALPQNPVNREIICQVMASGTSMGANYFEAQSASSKKDYQNFFHYSLKSSNETLFWLAVLRDSGLIQQPTMNQCQWLINETGELAKIFASSLLTMKGKR